MITKGVILAVGYHDPVPTLAGFPPGKVRIKMRAVKPVRVYVRNSFGFTGYYVTPVDGEWRPAFRIGQTHYLGGEASQWQPIDTVPKDGTWVLVYDKENGVFAATCHDYFWEADEMYWTSKGYMPECWMPLPEPPK